MDIGIVSESLLVAHLQLTKFSQTYTQKNASDREGLELILYPLLSYWNFKAKDIVHHKNTQFISSITSNLFTISLNVKKYLNKFKVNKYPSYIINA